MSHWVCAVIYMQEKRIQFYDSLGADGKDYLRHLLRYLQDDHKDKKNVPLPDPKSWKLVSCDRETTPQQPNCELLLSAFGVADFPRAARNLTRLVLSLRFCCPTPDCDCGVYTCLFADFVSLDCLLKFDQDLIPQCRDRIALAILRGST
jgi:sentrin-specific protease 1